MSASSPSAVIARPTFNRRLDELPSALRGDRRIAARVTRVRVPAGAPAAVIAALIAAAPLRG